MVHELKVASRQNEKRYSPDPFTLSWSEALFSSVLPGNKHTIRRKVHMKNEKKDVFEPARRKVLIGTGALAAGVALSQLGGLAVQVLKTQDL